MNDKYKSILNQVHHQSAERPRMSMLDRAAQFSSFAALTGHAEAIKEEARLVDSKSELNEQEIYELNTKLNLICKNISSKPHVTITYFVPDERKKGGKYVTVDCVIKAIDLVSRTIKTTEKNQIINIDDILEITHV